MSFLSCGNSFDGSVGNLAADGVDEGYAVEENKIHAKGEVPMVLENVGRKREWIGSWDLDGVWFGFVSFDETSVFAIDVGGALRIINGEGGVSNVSGGEEVLKVSWWPRANVVAEGAGFIR